MEDSNLSSSATVQDIAKLKKDIEKLQQENKDQWNHLMVQRKVQTACVFVIGLVLFMNLNLSEEHKSTLQQVMIGLVAAAATGVAGAPFVTPVRQDHTDGSDVPMAEQS